MPRGVRLGRNVKVGERVKSADFANRAVKSGGTVDHKPGGAKAARRVDTEEPPARILASVPD